MAKEKILITGEHALILIEALQHKVDELSKIATQLMKKNLQDAAGPVYAEIKRINESVSELEKGVNK